MQRILAVARLTLKGAFRVKVFVVLLAFLVFTVIALPLTVKGDGTVRGFVQVLLSYSLGISSAILSLATMWLACDSLCRDVEEKHIHLVATKPIYRWQIWLGKWVGIMVLNAMLLAMVGIVTYGLLLWTTRPGQLTKQERARLDNEVLVARRSEVPDLPDVSSQVEKQFQQNKASDKVPAGVSESDYRQQLRDQILAKEHTAGQLQQVRWVFSNIHLDPRRTSVVYVRFKFFTSVAPPTGQVTGRWLIGEPDSPNRYEMILRVKPESFHEFEAPASAVTKDGKLTVEYTNADMFPTTVVFPAADGIEVLHRVGSFEGNYIRSIMLMLAPLGLLTAIGLFCGSFLTFPVAVFASMSFLYLVLLSTPLQSIVTQTRIFQGHENGSASSSMTLLDNTVRGVINAGLFVTSSLRDYNPVGELVVGRVITWGWIAKAIAIVLFAQAGTFALLGMWLLTRRELAQLQH